MTSGRPAVASSLWGRMHRGGQGDRRGAGAGRPCGAGRQHEGSGAGRRAPQPSSCWRMCVPSSRRHRSRACSGSGCRCKCLAGSNRAGRTAGRTRHHSSLAHTGTRRRRTCRGRRSPRARRRGSCAAHTPAPRSQRRRRTWRQRTPRAAPRTLADSPPPLHTRAPYGHRRSSTCRSRRHQSRRQCRSPPGTRARCMRRPTSPRRTRTSAWCLRYPRTLRAQNTPAEDEGWANELMDAPIS